MAASYLTRRALGWFKAYHDEITQEIKFKTYAEFIRALKAAYDDPDKRATAECKLLALRQLNKDCSTYHVECSIYANALEYDDHTKISFFKKGANNDIQIALAHQLNPPNNFDKYVAMCIQLDNNIRNLKGQSTHHYSHPSQNPIVSSSPSVPASTSSGTAPGPMDLSALNRSWKRGPIDEAEKKGRRDNNLCIYCGQFGHWAANCPHKRQKLNTLNVNHVPVLNPSDKPEVLYSVEAKNLWHLGRTFTIPRQLRCILAWTSQTPLSPLMISWTPLFFLPLIALVSFQKNVSFRKRSLLSRLALANVFLVVYALNLI